MTVQTILDEVNQLIKDFEAQRQALVDKLQPEFVNLFKPFLDKHPLVKGLNFTAYTPYFNDGEECVYRVGELMFFLEGEEPQRYEGWGTWGCDYKAAEKFETYEAFKGSIYLDDFAELSEEQYPALKEALKDFQDIDHIVYNIPKDVIKQLFGDHVQVVITRNGVFTEEFDHD